jgi:hypothetical protein
METFSEKLSNLSPSDRNDVYRKALVVSHPLYVFQESDGRPVEIFAPGKPAEWPAQLLDQPQMPDEAKAVFYTSNHFHLVDKTQREPAILRSFLTSIGPVNAGLLSHISLSFPAIEKRSGHPEETVLRTDGKQSIELLQGKCTNIKMLELSVHQGNSRGLVEAKEEEFESFCAVLPQINTELSAISSLEKITVRFYHGRPASLVLEAMQRLGWVVRIGDQE